MNIRPSNPSKAAEQSWKVVEATVKPLLNDLVGTVSLDKSQRKAWRKYLAPNRLHPQAIYNFYKKLVETPDLQAYLVEFLNPELEDLWEKTKIETESVINAFKIPSTAEGFGEARKERDAIFSVFVNRVKEIPMDKRSKIYSRLGFTFVRPKIDDSQQRKENIRTLNHKRLQVCFEEFVEKLNDESRRTLIKKVMEEGDLKELFKG